jgi:hypothetical protein
VAFISDARRAALSQWFAEPKVKRSELQFAATTEDLQRAVTSGSLVLIEGSRLGELAGHRVREELLPSGESEVVNLGAVVEMALAALPATSRSALRQAFANPRVWSVKRLAHVAGVSTRQLVRQFRVAGFAVPPKDILLAARLATAQALLRGPRVQGTSDLARACGWVDVRSLRAALRCAGLPSVASLAAVADGHATVSDLVGCLAVKRT